MTKYFNKNNDNDLQTTKNLLIIKNKTHQKDIFLSFIKELFFIVVLI